MNKKLSFLKRGMSLSALLILLSSCSGDYVVVPMWVVIVVILCICFAR